MFKGLYGIALFILFLIVYVLLVVGQENGVGNMVAILLDQLLELPAVCIFRPFLIEEKGNGSPLLFTGGLFQGVGTFAGAGPFVSHVLTRFPANDLYFA